MVYYVFLIRVCDDHSATWHFYLLIHTELYDHIMDSTMTGLHVSVYCDRVGYHVLCLSHGFPVWQQIDQNYTATSRHRRNMFSDVKIC